jgi:hypothetical protein
MLNEISPLFIGEGRSLKEAAFLPQFAPEYKRPDSLA